MYIYMYIYKYLLLRYINIHIIYRYIHIYINIVYIFSWDIYIYLYISREDIIKKYQIVFKGLYLCFQKRCNFVETRKLETLRKIGTASSWVFDCLLKENGSKQLLHNASRKTARNEGWLKRPLIKGCVTSHTLPTLFQTGQ